MWGKKNKKRKKQNMKKLMFASALVAGASAFGGLCTPEDPTLGCSVYNVKFTFKTLAAKKACDEGAKWLVTDAAGISPVWYRSSEADDIAKEVAKNANRSVVEADDYLNQATPATFCNRTRTVTAASKRVVYWMDNATRKFDGVLWQCTSACFEGGIEDCENTNDGRINYAIWEKKTSLPISYPILAFKYYTDKDQDNAYSADDPIVGTEYVTLDASQDMWLGRYGKSAQKVAAYWEPSLLHAQTIDAAGFGTFDVKNLRIKSVSGNAVGMLAPIDEEMRNTCGDKGDKFFCAIGFMCTKWIDWCCDGCYAGVELVPASGTWSIKYNASATKKANADKATLRDFVPEYMFYGTASMWADYRNLDPFIHRDGYYYVDNDNHNFGYNTGSSVAEDNDEVIHRLALTASKVIDIVGDWTPVKTEGKVTSYKSVDGKNEVTVGDDKVLAKEGIEALLPSCEDEEEEGM